MAKDIKVYDLLISCPSDVSECVEMLEKEVNHFNNFFGRKNNIIVRTRHWSKDSYSEFGNQPQELLNKQIVDSSDMALGVFWTRFGTPTENYGSGTEEEIERMLSMGKQVFLYFLDKPLSPSKIDQEQYKKILLFKDKHKSEGIFFTIQDEKVLVNKFRENLELYFDSITRGEEFKKSSSKKEILWVDDRPENNVYERNIIEKYGLKDKVTLLGFRTDIVELCDAADCFVHPSVREGLGIAPLEAMAGGLPLISSYVNGIKDYTENGVSGCCLIDPLSVEEMKKAIQKMYENVEFRKKCGINNLKTVKRFDIKNTDEIMKDIYSQFL